MNGTYACVATLMGLAAVFPGSDPIPRADEIDPMVVSSISRPVVPAIHFTLKSSAADIGCSLTAHGTANPGAGERRLDLEPRCSAVAPELAGAQRWMQRRDGSVAFVRDDGSVVAEFAAADGAALESFRPREPILTLFASE